jgi:hypothetical protein
MRKKIQNAKCVSGISRLWSALESELVNERRKLKFANPEWWNSKL